MPRLEISQRIIDLINAIPEGKVSTYGRIAAMAGNPRGARQVVRILHACGRKEKLPWHRVVDRNGRIAIREEPGNELQKLLLESEGVTFQNNQQVDLDRYLWRPGDT